LAWKRELGKRGEPLDKEGPKAGGGGEKRDQEGQRSNRRRAEIPKRGNINIQPLKDLSKRKGTTSLELMKGERQKVVWRSGEGEKARLEEGKKGTQG